MIRATSIITPNSGTNALICASERSRPTACRDAKDNL
jgi:hypothetical protein